jgi:hypothetical protein
VDGACDDRSHAQGEPTGGGKLIINSHNNTRSTLHEKIRTPYTHTHTHTHTTHTHTHNKQEHEQYPKHARTHHRIHCMVTSYFMDTQ